MIAWMLEKDFIWLCWVLVHVQTVAEFSSQKENKKKYKKNASKIKII